MSLGKLARKADQMCIRDRYSVPTEPDLATIFDVAEQAGIVWLKFDSDAAGIDGLPIYEGEDPIS